MESCGSSLWAKGRSSAANEQLAPAASSAVSWAHPSASSSSLSGFRGLRERVRQSFQDGANTRARQRCFLKVTDAERQVVKEEDWRKVVSEVWEAGDARWVLERVKERPISSDPVVAFKCVFVLHRVLQQGPPETAAEWAVNCDVCEGLASHWARAVREGAGKCTQAEHCSHAVAEYARLILMKMELMIERDVGRGCFDGSFVFDRHLPEPSDSLEALAVLLNFAERLMPLALHMVSPSKDGRRLDRTDYMRVYLAAIIAIIDEAWLLLCAVSLFVKDLLCQVHQAQRYMAIACSARFAPADEKPPWLQLSQHLLAAQPRFSRFHAAMCDFVAHCHQLRCAGLTELAAHIPTVPQGLLNLFADLHEISRTASTGPHSSQACKDRSLESNMSSASTSTGSTLHPSSRGGARPAPGQGPRQESGGAPAPGADWEPSARVRDALRTVDSLQHSKALRNGGAGGGSGAAGAFASSKAGAVGSSCKNSLSRDYMQLLDDDEAASEAGAGSGSTPVSRSRSSGGEGIRPFGSTTASRPSSGSSDAGTPSPTASPSKASREVMVAPESPTKPFLPCAAVQSRCSPLLKHDDRGKVGSLTPIAQEQEAARPTPVRLVSRPPAESPGALPPSLAWVAGDAGGVASGGLAPAPQAQQAPQQWRNQRPEAAPSAAVAATPPGGRAPWSPAPPGVPGFGMPPASLPATPAIPGSRESAAAPEVDAFTVRTPGQSPEAPAIRISPCAVASPMVAGAPAPSWAAAICRTNAPRSDTSLRFAPGSLWEPGPGSANREASGTATPSAADRRQASPPRSGTGLGHPSGGETLAATPPVPLNPFSMNALELQRALCSDAEVPPVMSPLGRPTPPGDAAAAVPARLSPAPEAASPYAPAAQAAAVGGGVPARMTPRQEFRRGQTGPAEFGASPDAQRARVASPPQAAMRSPSANFVKDARGRSSDADGDQLPRTPPTLPPEEAMRQPSRSPREPIGAVAALAGAQRSPSAAACRGQATGAAAAFPARSESPGAMHDQQPKPIRRQQLQQQPPPQVQQQPQGQHRGQAQRQPRQYHQGAATPPAPAPPKQASPAQGATTPQAPEPGVLDSREWEVDPSEFRIEELLGNGSTADVYKAVWHGTDVAVKKLKNSGRLSIEFTRELSVLQRLRHPNLVLFMGASLAEPPMIISEYCAGGTLFAMLHQRPDLPLPWQQRLKVSIDVAKGMNFLHWRKIIHRDLKSLNLLLESPVAKTGDIPRVKVSDFGLSRVCGSGAMQTKTQACMTSGAGTYHWMAPEVLDGNCYDEKVDVYSYGICLFEVLARRIPFDGSGLEPVSIAVAVSKGRRPDTSCVPRSCPADLRFTMECCWAHSASRRPGFDTILETLKLVQCP